MLKEKVDLQENREKDDALWCIEHVRIVTPDEVIDDGSLIMRGSTIMEIDSSSGLTGPIPKIDGRGGWLLPGFVDIHADSLENAIAPRPSAPFPIRNVLPSYESTLALHGITTVFHCVGMAELGPLTKPLRNRQTALSILDELHTFLPTALLRNYIHLRYEILDTESLESILDLIEDERIHLLSLMDHTPGYGVFLDTEAYRDYHKRSGGTLAAADSEINNRLAMREKVDLTKLDKLIRLAREKNIAVVSHDDHNQEKVAWAASRAIGIAEFPVTMEAVHAARRNNMMTVFGAANLVRGKSHAGNLIAADMVREGHADIICSDYSPMCMVQGLFYMLYTSSLSMPELTAVFCSNPALAVGLDHVGTIEEGKEADLILVQEHQGPPRVERTFVGGRQVFCRQGLAY